MMAAIKTRSKDPTIQEAARQGVKVYKCGAAGYYTHLTEPVKEVAESAGCSERTLRHVCALNAAGGDWSARIMAGEAADKLFAELTRKPRRAQNGSTSKSGRCERCDILVPSLEAAQARIRALEGNERSEHGRAKG